MKKCIYMLMICFAIAGCSVGTKDNAREKPEKRNVSMRNVTYTDNNKPNEKVADHLASLAASIPGVRDATAVVIGKYAVVGIDVKAKLDRSRVESIKYSVAESLKHDPKGANAVVVADVDTYERLKQMGNQIRHGKAGEGILDELAAIVGRVMPQVPNDMIENKETDPIKDNDKQLPKNEENELKKEQKDQSNHHLQR
ncbi:YhcN/YlaJ family sporulation lipoprotein [Bacillus cytotoxicus]|uniref:Sporulation lipoprotein YhcN/YlaJ n=2 Tax=Bacillus cytotoxicus TaxID=580165 RepID=A0AAX2CHM6_9BACI|nr:MULTISPECIES: YhcN/YlaJ family sporulation lipoprotein [Bacillus cereus group]ABS22183.1 Sporulation lipoprotein YhcN/YlaJ [Bacillus cytotoxicus NVH 391-98]AWC28803.1 YhcN/YlaJ family sporulation lipoprotein [Bacillus cytotoxicus]AWC32808.1 YhcN/YlaJ family sporulation lipoprotein [Bacillus cytotoxicus]AWC36835.1 YhcN/YlaJ family sporulation lipoprotein [Bacillus cytotoxicus]AWC39814.1 YhcN/YlaJ family sporulation lipoprotein [Bacillus cytotoxicus]